MPQRDTNPVENLLTMKKKRKQIKQLHKLFEISKRTRNVTKGKAHGRLRDE